MGTADDEGEKIDFFHQHIIFRNFGTFHDRTRARSNLQFLDEHFSLINWNSNTLNHVESAINFIHDEREEIF
jgi:hypothetical protein